MPKQTGHAVSITKVCIFCFGSSKRMRPLRDYPNMKRIIPNYDEFNSLFPTVCCSTCDKLFTHFVKSSNNINHPIIFANLYKTSEILKTIKFCKTTRSPICMNDCLICLRYKSFNRNSKIPQQYQNTFKFFDKKKVHQQQNTSVKVCKSCLSPVAKGKIHKCNKYNLKTNLVDRLNTCHLKDEIILKSIKSKRTKRFNQKIVLKQHNNQNCVMLLRPKLSRASANDIVGLQKTLKSSLRQTKVIESWTRKIFGRNSLESNIPKTIKSNINEIAKFYSSKEMDFSKTIRKESTTHKGHVVYCNDVHGLINYVCEKRDILEKTLKIGIDGGKSSFKICLSILHNADVGDDNEETFETSSGGVRGVFVLLIVFNVQENYSNVKSLWNILNLSDLQFYLAVDLKIANILCGIMPHSSKFPCCWCWSEKKFTSETELRTFKEIKEFALEWQSLGSKSEQTATFKCCINEPIITGLDDDPVIALIVPPALHLFLGMFNKCYEQFEKDFKEIAHEWSSKSHVQKDRMYGTGFNGNACRLLLRNIGKIKSHCMNIVLDEVSRDVCLNYIAMFEAMDALITSCFKNELATGYEEKIDEFEKAFRLLGISVTPKIHAIFQHIKQFLGHRNRGLGFYSEHCFESVHHRFSEHYKHYTRHPKHPDFCSKLLACVISFNNLNVLI